MVVLGGVTRLTRSGLSMVDWDPIMGIVPPLTEAQWQHAFERYRQFPEYREVNIGMDLEGFKRIFYVEYAHRVLGRLIGLAFLLPFLYFLVRRRIPPGLAPKLAAIFVLGGLQGLLGWYMVRSGLADDPHVSPYRLTAHLTMAVLIYGYTLWVALGLLFPRRSAPAPGAGMATTLSALTLLMIMSGGLVAGTRAGFAYSTWPLMGDHFAPPGLLLLEPWYRNVFENIVTVQFDHRLLAYVLFAGVVVFFWRHGLRAPTPRARTGAWLWQIAILVQLGLGISTLLLHVPVPLAAAHQGGALLVLAAALFTTHALRHP